MMTDHRQNVAKAFYSWSILVLLLVSIAATGEQGLGAEQATQPRVFGRASNSLAQQPKPVRQSATQDARQVTRQVSNVSERSANLTSNQAASGKFDNFVEDELPVDFYEMPAEQLDLGMNATGRAPVPILNVVVLQDGQLVDSANPVHPGTPLEMVIYLDDKSAKVYGLLASYLKVQDDTFRQREEVIILNGCSIDSHIFGNFEHNLEDQSLRAKFKAFKFPESNFVRFVGTVNVCIKQCAKVNCNGGNSGSPGLSRRKKRAPPSSASATSVEDQKLVQMTVSTVLRIAN